MTEQNLRYIAERTTLPHEVIVIDNGSPVHRAYNSTNPTYVWWGDNRGIAKAWNWGIKLAQGDTLIFLNNDVEVQKDWDRYLTEPTLKLKPSICFPYTDHGDGQGFRIPDTGGVAGWCWAMSRDTQKRVGLLDEGFSPAFYEDTDYFHRAWQQKIELISVPNAQIIHTRRSTAKHLVNGNLLFMAHRLKYAWKWGLDPNEIPPFYGKTTIWSSCS